MFSRYRIFLIRLYLVVIHVGFALSTSSAPMTGIVTLALVAAARLLSRNSTIKTLVSSAWRGRGDLNKLAARAKVADRAASF